MRFPPLKPGTIAHDARRQANRRRPIEIPDDPRDVKLTPVQRHALIIISDGGQAQVTAPGHRLTHRRIAYVTAEYLVVLGFARALPPPAEPPAGVLGEIVITKTGQAILAFTLARATPETPVYLHARDGLTPRRGEAAAGEPEVIDFATLDAFWREQALLRHREAEGKPKAARRLRNQARAA